MVNIFLDHLIAPRPRALTTLVVHGFTALGFEVTYIRDGLPRDSSHKLTETECGVDSQSRLSGNPSGGPDSPQDSGDSRSPSEMRTKFAVVEGFGVLRERFRDAAAEAVGKVPPRSGATDISVSILHVGATLWISGCNPTKGFSARFSVACPDKSPGIERAGEARDAWHLAALELAAGLVGVCIGRPPPTSFPDKESPAGHRAHGPLVSP